MSSIENLSKLLCNYHSLDIEDKYFLISIIFMDFKKEKNIKNFKKFSNFIEREFEMIKIEYRMKKRKLYNRLNKKNVFN